MKKIIYGLMAFGPVLALAQTGPGTIVSTATTWATGFKSIVNILIPAFFGLAVIYFFWGMAKYILAAGDQEKAREGKSIMIYGVIAIAIMASLYGIIAFITSSVGVGSGSAPVLPQV